MSETTYQLIAIGVYFALMIAIGFYAYTRTRNIDGYMLAERGLHPAVAALSANAADMSGWLLMGLPGAIYASGLIESWIAIGLTIGAWLNWKFVAPGCAPTPRSLATRSRSRASSSGACATARTCCASSRR